MTLASSDKIIPDDFFSLPNSPLFLKIFNFLLKELACNPSKIFNRHSFLSSVSNFSNVSTAWVNFSLWLLISNIAKVSWTLETI